MKKIIKFGKIDYKGIGRKTNMVTINLELDEKVKSKPVFSVSANIWNSKQTEIITCGQCLDELFEFFKDNILFFKIYELWEKYHLNNLHAGTKKQEDFLKKQHIKNWGTNYKKICDLLDENNLLYDNGVKFGATWNYWDIPEKDLKIIKDILQEEENNENSYKENKCL